MKMSKVLSVAIVVCLIIGFSSCKKKGCMDPYAINYNEKAKKDDPDSPCLYASEDPENKNVVLIDDVLFTGRSIKAAMSSIDSYGRPNSIELLVLIDRRYRREIPIQANYCGAKIDTFKGDKVNVVWNENSKKDVIYIENNG